MKTFHTTESSPAWRATTPSRTTLMHWFPTSSRWTRPRRPTSPPFSPSSSRAPTSFCGPPVSPLARPRWPKFWPTFSRRETTTSSSTPTTASWKGWGCWERFWRPTAFSSTSSSRRAASTGRAPRWTPPNWPLPFIPARRTPRKRALCDSFLTKTIRVCSPSTPSTPRPFERALRPGEPRRCSRFSWPPLAAPRASISKTCAGCISSSRTGTPPATIKSWVEAFVSAPTPPGRRSSRASSPTISCPSKSEPSASHSTCRCLPKLKRRPPPPLTSCRFDGRILVPSATTARIRTPFCLATSFSTKSRTKRARLPRASLASSSRPPSTVKFIVNFIVGNSPFCSVCALIQRSEARIWPTIPI